jgi:DNA-binding transcriptional ArsR family regulator
VVVTEPDAKSLARWGGLLHSEARASLLTALMSGTAHTHTELARFLRLAPSSVSEHVGVLLDAGLIVTEAQGRHRYVRLADGDVAELLERLANRDLGPGARAPLPRIAADLSFARSCYGHLAGELAVCLFDGLLRERWIEPAEGHLRLTECGIARFDELDVRPDRGHAPPVRACLDWSHRRHHLAGRYGDALLSRGLEIGWFRRHARRPRVLELTSCGRTDFPRLFPIEVL